MRSRGQKSEIAFTKRIGGRRQPRSGGILGFPGDTVKGRWLIEQKSTVKKSIAVKLEYLEKIHEAALRHGKLPALAIIFNRPKPQTSPTWICIPETLWESMGK